MHLVSALNLIYCRYIVLKFNSEQRYYQHPVYNHNKVVAKSEFLRTYFFQLAVNIFCFIRFIAVGTQFGLLRSSWKKKSALVGESSKFQSTSTQCLASLFHRRYQMTKVVYNQSFYGTLFFRRANVSPMLVIVANVQKNLSKMVLQ